MQKPISEQELNCKLDEHHITSSSHNRLGENFWAKLCVQYVLPEPFIEEHIDDWDLTLLLTTQKLSENFLKKYRYRFHQGHYPTLIVTYQDLSNEFLAAESLWLDWELVFKFQQIDTDRIDMFKHQRWYAEGMSEDYLIASHEGQKIHRIWLALLDNQKNTMKFLGKIWHKILPVWSRIKREVKLDISFTQEVLLYSNRLLATKFTRYRMGKDMAWDDISLEAWKSPQLKNAIDVFWTVFPNHIKKYLVQNNLVDTVVFFNNIHDTYITNNMIDVLNATQLCDKAIVRYNQPYNHTHVTPHIKRFWGAYFLSNNLSPYIFYKEYTNVMKKYEPGIISIGAKKAFKFKRRFDLLRGIHETCWSLIAIFNFDVL